MNNKINLLEFSRCIYSEYSQDGVLEKIFDTIGTTNKYFVELGSNGRSDGRGNTPYLRKKLNFTGLLVDAGEFSDTEYELKTEFISAENINDIFDKYSVPNKFDYLGIDIDGEDYHVMKSIDLNRFTPRVITIEFNTAIQPNKLLVQPHNKDWRWDGWHYYGCSLGAITNLMNSVGYDLVCVCGCDAVFVDNKEAFAFSNINAIDYLYNNGAQKPQEDLLYLDELLMQSNFFIEIR